MGLIGHQVCFLSIVFVYTLPINVLDVSHILVGRVIFRAKPDEKHCRRAFYNNYLNSTSGGLY